MARSSGTQELRNSGAQELRSSGTLEPWNSLTQGHGSDLQLGTQSKQPQQTMGITGGPDESYIICRTPTGPPQDHHRAVCTVLLLRCGGVGEKKVEVFLFLSCPFFQSLASVLIRFLRSGPQGRVTRVCLRTLRILSRDKQVLDCLLTDSALITLARLAGLSQAPVSGEDLSDHGDPYGDVVKALSDLESNEEEDDEACAENEHEGANANAASTERRRRSSVFKALARGKRDTRASVVEDEDEEEEEKEGAEKWEEEKNKEAVKILCNVIYNSAWAQERAAELRFTTLQIYFLYSLLSGLTGKLEKESQSVSPPCGQYYELRLVFLLTALRPELRNQLKQEGGVTLLTAVLERCVSVQWKEQYEVELDPSAAPVSVEDSLRAQEALKILFNITYSTHTQEPGEEDAALYRHLAAVLRHCLMVRCEGEEADELKGHTVNLLSALPLSCLDVLLCVPLRPDSQQMDGVNMDCVHALLGFLENRLEKGQKVKERLTPVLNLLTECSRAHRGTRRYLRQQDPHRTTTEQVVCGWWIILSTAVTLTLVLVCVDQTQQCCWSVETLCPLTVHSIRHSYLAAPPCRWTVRDDSSSAAAQCSAGHPLVLHQWSQDTAHRTLPLRTLPHRTLPHRTVPHRTVPHRTLPHRTVPHRTLPTGRCPTGRCPTGRCSSGRCPQDVDSSGCWTIPSPVVTLRVIQYTEKQMEYSLDLYTYRVSCTILPPLRDVSVRPEEGTTVKSRLVRLMTHLDTELKHCAADLLFVLCKENVRRFVKYTGYGNAAGLLATRGLLGGQRSKATSSGMQYSSDSDSDTEEYRQVKGRINPVTGKVEEEQPDPMEGMTEEEKEEEARRLVSLINKLSK
ncbi:hypothetical protein NFI96_028672 [Prochilodus magdalenae]|nr:hypothetical protein NFI96_028672 [Prochilodus magdalenae]